MSRVEKPYAFKKPEYNFHFTEKILLNIFSFITLRNQKLIKILRNKYQHMYIKLL